MRDDARPSPQQRSMNATEWALLLLLALLWGGSFFFAKVALAGFPPLVLVALRTGLAALALIAFLAATGRGLPVTLAAWRGFLAMGLFNNAVPFALINWGQTQIDSGLAAILNATTPLFTVLLAHVWTVDEKLTRNRVAGVLLGLAGVIVMIGPSALRGPLLGALGLAGLGKLAVVCAALSYAGAGLYGRRLTGLSPVVAACGMLVALFSTWLGRERGAAVMGAEPSDSRSVVFAMVSSFAFLFAILGVIIAVDYKHKQQLLTAQNAEELQVEQMLDIPTDQPTPDPGTAGLNKGSGGGSKPKPEKAAGGGGGGREDPKPASYGKVPQASLEVPQVVAPDPKPPQIKNPSLPVAATVVADPMLVPPDARVLPYGDFKSKSTDPSSGPGTGNGIGAGKGGGIGPGEGGGLGPGRGGNMGGGDFNAGGGGPGGPGGGDYTKIFTGKEVTAKARLISKPEPQYTEDARKNQIVGTVVLKVVFASSGQITNIRTVSGLPYGLTERAIAAARQIKFVPATKDGHQVSMWMQLEYNFNLY